MNNITEQEILKKKYVTNWNFISSGVYFSTRLNRYVRVYRGSRSSYLKRKCNKKIRKCQDEILNGNMYRRVGNFWNEYW
jgi:hypothetical protein